MRNIKVEHSKTDLQRHSASLLLALFDSHVMISYLSFTLSVSVSYRFRDIISYFHKLQTVSDIAVFVLKRDVKL